MSKITTGGMTPIIETVEIPPDLITYFRILRGKSPHSLLFESKETTPKYGDFSIGTNDPALKISGKGEFFNLEALNSFGRSLLKDLKGRLSFCEELVFEEDRAKGRLQSHSRFSMEDEMGRLKTLNHMDLLRTLAFSYQPTRVPDHPYCGLFGVFAYDFIDQFEELPPAKVDNLGTPDYLFYFVDNLFVVDHRIQKMHLIANAIGIKDLEEEFIHQRCLNKIQDYKKALMEPSPLGGEETDISGVTSDTSREEYLSMVNTMKEHILRGDVFQVVPSRTIEAHGRINPIQIYERLRTLNPSTYMFFIDFNDHQLVGSSPEVAIRVKGRDEKKIEIRPIAGTKPRGFKDGKIDQDLDSRYEVELKTDEKELSEHMMLVDLARNDTAKVAIPGTRVVDQPLVIEKYSHVQHLVSGVSGVLKEEFDALHAYLATMNMGTICGAPKIEAMKILRENEVSKRGYYGGATAYISPDGDFDSGLVIRSIVIKDGCAYVRVGAGIVHDSIPESEYRETDQKASACLKVITGEGL